MFTQKLRLPYMESSAGTSSAFFRPEYTQYSPQWEASSGPGAGNGNTLGGPGSAHTYDNHGVYDTESDSALTRIYTLNDDEKPLLMSPLVSDQLNRMEMFTPEMKQQHRFDELELQVLSSAPSELSSWSESEERPNLVKYDSESSLEHYHNIHFSPQQYPNCGARLNFNHGPDTGFNHDALYALGTRGSDQYHPGWRYFGHEMDNGNHVDLSEMVEGVFPGSSTQAQMAASPAQKHTEFSYAYKDGSSHNMPVGLRNALNASHRVFHLALEGTNGKGNGTKSPLKLVGSSKSGTNSGGMKMETPLAENFMLRPWPVNDNVGKTGTGLKGNDINATLRVPLPCLSATERWNKHVEKYHLDQKLCGDMVCTHCDQTFDDVHRYITHLDEEKIVHDNFCPDTSCSFAALGYRYRWLLRRHICNHHLKDYNNKKLRKGPASPSGKNALIDNFLSHVYVCKKKNCLRAFYRLDSLLRHEKLIHSAGVKQKRKERLKLGKCDPKVFE